MVKRALLILVILTCAITFVGCAKDLSHDETKRAAGDQKLNQVFKLIDQNRYDEALREMADLERIDPSHPEKDTTKASIYLARAGVRADQLINAWSALQDGMLRGAGQGLPSFDKYQRAMVRLRKVSEPLALAFQKSLEVMATAFTVSTYLRQIPQVPESKRSDLYAAEKVLASATNLRKSGYLYRAVIRGVILRSYFTAAQLSGPAFPESLVCGTSVERLKSQADGASNWMRLIAQDLQIALPAHNDKWLKIIQLSKHMRVSLKSEEMDDQLQLMKIYEQEGWICQ